MKNIVKIIIRLFSLYIIVIFITSLPMSVNRFIEIIFHNQINNSYLSNFTEFEIKIRLIIIIFEWLIYILLPIIFWGKSEKLSETIVGKYSDEKIDFIFDYNKLLSFGIIVLCLFIIIFRIPMFLSFIVNNLSHNLIEPYWRNYISEFIFQTISQILGILIPIFVIKYRDKIVKIINFKN
jgi:hypothetical protein